MREPPALEASEHAQPGSVTPPDWENRMPVWAWCAGLAVVYFIIGKAGIALARGFNVGLPIWPGAGLALAALLLLGYRVWPGVLAGAFLVNLASLSGPHFLSSIFAALIIGTGNMLEALAGAWLANRFARGREAFWHPASILIFVGLSAMVASAIGASFGLAARLWTHNESGYTASDLWCTWWLADVVSAIVLAPLLVIWSVDRGPQLNCRRGLEAMLLLASLVLICELAFEQWLPPYSRGIPLTFTVIPLLLWAALRFGLQGASALSFLVACFATAGTLHGHGLFMTGTHLTSVLLLQNYIAVTTVMSLVLAADVVQRQQVDAGLRTSELRYRELFEHNPQPMWVFDNETLHFLAVNEAALNQYGYTRSEFLSLSLTDVRPPEEVPKLQEALARAREGKPVPRQWLHRKKDGTLMQVEIFFHYIRFDDRPAVIVLSIDITDRLEAERQTAAFSELSRRLSAASTAREAAGLMAETAEHLFGWDACCLDLRALDNRDVHTVYCADTVGGRRSELSPLDAKMGPLTRRTLEGGPQLISRCEISQPFSPGEMPFGDTTRRSACMMFVPVRKDARALGVFSIHSYIPGAYSPDDLNVLQGLADLCAGAFERIRAEQEVQRLNRELRHHLEELQTIFNVAPVGIALARDPHCRVITGNPACAALLGLHGQLTCTAENATEEAPRQMLRQGQPVPPSELPMQSAARLGRPVTGEELDILLKDGRVLNAYVSASPLYDESGQVRGSLGVFVDITQQKQAELEVLRLNSELERRVAQRTAQLESANRELEAFCYSVSHDLRAPLRSIRGFGEVLLQRYGHALDARGQELLRRSCDSSLQMDKLIEDLLNLSRVGRAELRRGNVDISALAASVAAELRQTEPQRAVDFQLSPGLQTTGDERLIRIVLSNLLCNAWKFTSHQPQPRVELGFIRQPQPAFFVRDNGAGFNMRYAGRLFGVFQRLHSASEFPGTGVGLATVQRIINRHGGRVWAEGAVDQGATFYFSLPADEKS